MALISYQNLFIGGQCNNCKNCRFTEERYFKPFEEIQKEIEQTKSENICICGGEPTVHPNLLEIVKALKAHGVKRVKIRTNGRMLSNPRVLKEILLAGAHVLEVKMFSADSELQDRLAKSGSAVQIRKALKNIKELKCRGPITKMLPGSFNLYRMPTTILRIPMLETNIASLGKTAEFACRNGVEEILLDFTCYDGDIARIEKAVSEAVRLSIENNTWIVFEGLPLCLAPGLEEHVSEIYSKPEGLRKTKECGGCIFRELCPGIAENSGIERAVRTVKKNGRYESIMKMNRAL